MTIIELERIAFLRAAIRAEKYLQVTGGVHKWLSSGPDIWRIYGEPSVVLHHVNNGSLCCKAEDFKYAEELCGDELARLIIKIPKFSGAISIR